MKKKLKVMIVLYSFGCVISFNYYLGLICSIIFLVNIYEKVELKVRFK